MNGWVGRRGDEKTGAQCVRSMRLRAGATTTQTCTHTCDGRCAHRRPRLLHGGGVAWRAVWAAADMSARGRRHTHCYLRKKKVMSMGRAMMMIGTRGVVLRASDRRGENDRRACTDMRTNGVSVGVGWVGGTEKSYEACPLCQLAPQDEHTGSRSTRRDGRQKMRRARGCAGRRCV